MKKKNSILIIFLILVLVIGSFILATLTKRFLIKKPAITSGVSTETDSLKTNSESEKDQEYTQYTNEEFGFLLEYSADWALPEEERITPPQQHLYTINLSPDKEVYLINIYDQPSPISLSSFVRSYFDLGNGFIWTQETEVNGQEALQFVLPQDGLAPIGIGAVAFRQGTYILIIQTPPKEAPEDDLKQLINDSRLIQLTESFQWLE
jgi:hypothetical protein